MAHVDPQWEKLLKKSRPSVFSDELVFDILSRLPVKSVIRFKCVCKNWCELFGDKSFVAAHLKLSAERSIYCNRKDDSFYKSAPLRVGYSLSDEKFEEFPEFPFQTEPSFCCEIIASVDGLVCVKKMRNLNLESSILLWNPATRESRLLPECPDRIHHVISSVGFGFAPKINDYKVVTMATFEKAKRVYVYSLRNDEWRSFKVDYFTAFHIHGAHVNGRLHWLAARGWSNRFIVSIDLTDEKIIEIGVPIDMNLVGLVSLKSLGKSLVVHLCNDEGETQIWFMKKYGDSKSWSKLYNFPPHPMYGYILRNQCFFLENGQVIMHCSDIDNMISYDPKTQVYKILHIKAYEDIIKYKESLVSVEGDGSISKP